MSRGPSLRHPRGHARRVADRRSRSVATTRWPWDDGRPGRPDPAPVQPSPTATNHHTETEPGGDAAYYFGGHATGKGTMMTDERPLMDTVMAKAGARFEDASALRGVGGNLSAHRGGVGARRQGRPGPRDLSVGRGVHDRRQDHGEHTARPGSPTRNQQPHGFSRTSPGETVPAQRIRAVRRPWVTCGNGPAHPGTQIHRSRGRAGTVLLCTGDPPCRALRFDDRSGRRMTRRS